MIKEIVLLAIILLASCVDGYAYDMPTGIPDPGFGLDEVKPARPSNWNSEVPGFYYVEDVGGCSTTNTYGYPGSPICYIPDPIPAGSYVELHGTYKHTTAGVIKIKGNGTAANPVWVVGESHDKMPNVIDNTYISGSYVYLEDIRGYFTGSNDSFKIGHNGSPEYLADHIMFRNCIAEGNNGTVRTQGFNFASDYDDGQKTEYVIVDKCIVRNHGPLEPQPTYDLDAHAILLGKTVEHIWILENEIYHCGGSGMVVGQEGDLWHYTDCKWIYAGRNHVYDTLQAGLSVKGSWHVVFSENNIHDQVTRWYDGIIGGYAASSSKCFGYKGEPQDYWVINNTCYGDNYGMHGGATIDYGQFNIYVIGNTINDIFPSSPDKFTGENTWDSAAISMVRGGYVYAIGNSIYDSSSGINAAGPGGDMAELYHYYITNNIISDIGYAHMAIGSRDTPSQTYVRNNIIYQPDNSDEMIYWGSTQYINDIPGWQSASGTGANVVKADPKFVFQDYDNLRLLTGSPAENNALSDTELTDNVFATYQSLYGVDIKNDIDHLTRPTGAGWDEGAFELGNTTGPAILSITPQGEQIAGTTQVTLSVTTDVDSICKYNNEGIRGIPYEFMHHTFPGSGTTHQITIDGLEKGGTYSTAIRCSANGVNNNSDYLSRYSVDNPDPICDSENLELCHASLACTSRGGYWASTGDNSFDGTCVKDSSLVPSGPKIFNIYPRVGQPANLLTQVTLSITTDVNSTCKYGDDRQTGVTYDNLPNTFETTGGTTHTQLISGLVNAHKYIYEVRCSDGTTSNDQDYIIAFEMSNPVNSIGHEGPLRTGISAQGTLAKDTLQTTLSVTTDVDSVCKYMLYGKNIDYDTLPNTFETTGGTTHTQLISGLVDGDKYSWEVRCSDGTTVNNTDYYITAAVNTEETCFDGVRNQDETDIDCGGVCPKCISNIGTSPMIQ